MKTINTVSYLGLYVNLFLECVKQTDLPARSSWNVNVSQRGKHSWKIWVKVKGSPLFTALVLNYFASLDAVPNSHPAKLNPIKQINPLQCGNAFFSSMKTLILVKTFNVILSVISLKGYGFLTGGKGNKSLFFGRKVTCKPLYHFN